MDKFLNCLKKIFFLKPLPTVLISIPSFTLVIFCLTKPQYPVLSYVSYALSAFALVITLTAIIRFSKPTKDKVKSNKHYKKYSQDIALRTKIFLDIGLLINVIYIIIKLFSGIYYNSFWFVSIALYYVVLTIIKLSLRGHINTANTQKELKITRLVGILLLVLNQILVAIVFFMVRFSRGYSYPGMLIYVMAAYTFYSLSVAITNLAKHRKHKSYALISVKVVNLTAALVSLLSLETAMLSTFSANESAEFNKTMVLCTGIGVCIVVLSMAIYMIIYANKLIKSNKS